MSLSDILTTIQQGVSAVNNLGMFLGQATINSSSIRVAFDSTYYLTPASTNFLPSSTPISTTSGTVTQVNTGVGLTGGPITISGTLAVNLSFLTNSLTSNVAVSSNPATYVDGPSVAQGTSGTWFASGQVTLNNTAGGANLFVKLWDGTSVIDSAGTAVSVINNRIVTPLSGVITSPASNIKISVNGPDGSTSSVIEFNRSGNSKDSTVTVVRIG